MSLSDELRALAGNNELLYTVGRRAVEDVLVEFRDARISFPLRNNGLVIKEVDGEESCIIRMGAESAISIALNAIADHLDKE